MDLLLDEETGDLADTFDGDLLLASGDLAVEQYLAQKLRLYLSEWFLGLNSGIPYLDEAFSKSPDWNILDAIFKNEILTTPGVSELASFSMELDGQTRLLRVRFVARLESGANIEFNQQLP